MSRGGALTDRSDLKKPPFPRGILGASPTGRKWPIADRVPGFDHQHCLTVVLVLKAVMLMPNRERAVCYTATCHLDLSEAHTDMGNETEKQRQVATLVAERATDSEREALIAWATQLLEIRNSTMPTTKKASEAVKLTARSEVIWPSAKIIGREIKRHAWDERSLKGRMGLGAAAIGAAVFQGQAAGIAALGTAIGVPLWVVLGAGGAFAGMLIEEISGKGPPKTTYTTIDAEKDDE